jgi:hypothetical protein
MPFIRLLHNDGTWAELEKQWSDECKAFDAEIENFARQSLSHARSIASEVEPDPRYGIFGLKLGGSYSAIIHANRAGLPGTSGWTLRLLWVLLAPRYDFAEITLEEFAGIAASLVHGAVDIACGEMRCDHIKIHLGNLGDRTFFTGVGESLRLARRISTVKIKGNWLHIDDVKSLDNLNSEN